MGAQDNTTLQSEYILKNYYYVSTANIVVTKAVSWFHRSLQNILQEQFLFKKCPRSPRTFCFYLSCGWRRKIFLKDLQSLSDSYLHPAEVQLLPEARLLLTSPLQIPEENLQAAKKKRQRLWTTSKDSTLEDLYNFYNRNSEKC